MATFKTKKSIVINLWSLTFELLRNSVNNDNNGNTMMPLFMYYFLKEICIFTGLHIALSNWIHFIFDRPIQP